MVEETPDAPAAPEETPEPPKGWIRLIDGACVRAAHITALTPSDDSVALSMLSGDTFVSAGDTEARLLREIARADRQAEGPPVVPPGRRAAP